MDATRSASRERDAVADDDGNLGHDEPLAENARPNEATNNLQPPIGGASGLSTWSTQPSQALEVGGGATEMARLLPAAIGEQQGLHKSLPSLPEPPLPSSLSLSDREAKRLSVSSTHSLASARGAASSSASIYGSDSGSVARSVSAGLIAAGKNPGQTSSLSDAGLSNVTVKTSSGQSGVSQQLGSVVQHTDVMKRSSTARDQLRSQVTRSRSRANRRLSGSAGAGSHSPSGDRVPSQREREDVKPAVWGVIGVCALDVKARSKPSRNILNRLIANREFDVVVFGDKVILDEAIENWPVCDYLISFYSDGFPLDKAIAYVKARKPFCVNDVTLQKILWDRRVCLRLLDKIGVPTPGRLEVSRDGGPRFLTPEICKHVKDMSGIVFEPSHLGQLPHPKLIETAEDGDVLIVDGARLKKPFVEKPISGEDHNIVIYFPKSEGGGARRLFRKIGNKSSEFVPDLKTPRAITEPENSFIYEQFMQVDNAEDVKAYTVGPSYCHAETRKSPVVDGLVRRNTHGKEIRYVTALNPDEKGVASKIATAFGQRVCGFDFLRAGGKSYVIDVNGWSFVKDNDDYYERCASILKDVFVKERLRKGAIAPPLPSPAHSDFDLMAKASMLAGKDNLAARSTGSLAVTLSGQEGSKKNSSTASLCGSPKSEPLSGSKGPSTSVSPLPVPPVIEMPESKSTSSAAESVHSVAPPSLHVQQETPGRDDEGTEETPGPPPPPLPKHSWKLKGVVSVIRHGDRTPKQKLKFTFHTKPFVELLKGHQEEVLLVGDAALGSVLQAVDTAMNAGIEDRARLRSLRNVLVKKGSWKGTKIQIKPMFRQAGTTPAAKGDASPAAPDTDPLSTELPSTELPSPAVPDDDPAHQHDPGMLPKRHDSLYGVTMSKFTAAEESLVFDKLQLIVKWGGEPTHSARYQAQELGESMRNDLLLLNRDVLDEVHIFSSSERRVSTSAQIWATSFLGMEEVLDESITIRKDLLDDSNAAKDEMDKVKKKLKGLLREGSPRPPQFAWPEKMAEPAEVQNRVVQLMNFHRTVMQYNYGRLFSGAVNALNAVANLGPEKSPGETSNTSMASALSSQAKPVGGIQSRWCSGEDAELFRERWEKLFAEFCDGDKIDPSKISELYDTMKFDALHNRQFLLWVFTPPKDMLHEEYGLGKGEEAKSSGESRSDSNGGGNGNGGKEKDKADSGSSSSQASSVRRLFRRPSLLSGLRHVGQEDHPEEYFRLFKGNASSASIKKDVRLEPLEELYTLAKVLFDFICPQEYGISDKEKLEIGLLTSLPLLKEIVQDLEEMQASSDAKSFFYFTKESHIYTLLNCILEGGIETKIKRSTIPELDYFSQICFELYESETTSPVGRPAGDEPTFEYSIRITISPGCHVFDPLHIQLDSKHSIGCAMRRSLTAHHDWMQVIRTLREKFNQVKLPKSFLAVNLSDAFSFECQEASNMDDDDDDGKNDLEMKKLLHVKSTPESGEPAGGEGQEQGEKEESMA